MLRNFRVLMLVAALALAAPAGAEEDVAYLLTAAAKGDIATVQAMLDSGASPNAKDAEGITALMYAARKNKAEVVQALADKGADLNAKDSGG